MCNEIIDIVIGEIRSPRHGDVAAVFGRAILDDVGEVSITARLAVSIGVQSESCTGKTCRLGIQGSGSGAITGAGGAVTCGTGACAIIESFSSSCISC